MMIIGIPRRNTTYSRNEVQFILNTFDDLKLPCQLTTIGAIMLTEYLDRSYLEEDSDDEDDDDPTRKDIWPVFRLIPAQLPQRSYSCLKHPLPVQDDTYCRVWGGTIIQHDGWRIFNDHANVFEGIERTIDVYRRHELLEALYEHFILTDSTKNLYHPFEDITSLTKLT